MSDELEVKRLVTALNHSVRTPLSIISNELAYLSTVYGEEEVQLSRRALGKLVSLLERGSALLTGSADCDTRLLTQIVSDLQFITPRAEFVFLTSSRIEGLKGSYQECIAFLSSVSELLSAILTAQPLTITVSAEAELLTLEGRADQIIQKELRGTYRSFKDLFEDKLNTESPLVYFLDYYLIAKGRALELHVLPTGIDVRLKVGSRVTTPNDNTEEHPPLIKPTS